MSTQWNTNLLLKMNLRNFQEKTESRNKSPEQATSEIQWSYSEEGMEQQ